LTGIGHIHRQTGREAERQRDGECSVEREVVFGISLVRDQKQPQMSSSSHSVSASDGSRCVAGARLSWSSCFVFRTWVLPAKCSFLQSDISVVRYTARDAGSPRKRGSARRPPHVFAHLHASSRPAAAGIRVLVKFLGMGCLDHIHNTDQVTCSSRPCCCRWRF